VGLTWGRIGKGRGFIVGHMTVVEFYVSSALYSGRDGFHKLNKKSRQGRRLD
jgi:hypothetical protein